jgi:hypothetical protein
MGVLQTSACIIVAVVYCIIWLSLTKVRALQLVLCYVLAASAWGRMPACVIACSGSVVL